jgi:hypothetical protein
MLWRLLRWADARADWDGGVDVAPLRLGLFDIIEDCVVRYASAGEEPDLKGCWSVGAKVNGALSRT